MRGGPTARRCSSGCCTPSPARACCSSAFPSFSLADDFQYHLLSFLDAVDHFHVHPLVCPPAVAEEPTLGTLLLHECENEFTRLTNELSEHRLRVLEDAEKLGRIAANVDHITEENTRLKECLGLALDLLAKHEIPHTIWHN